MLNASSIIYLQDYTQVFYESWYPPLGVEDFPYMENLTTEAEAKSSSEYRFRDSLNGIANLEEIYSLCSTHDTIVNCQNYAGLIDD